MSETGVVKGFKVFNSDWTCSPNGNTKQYTCPGKFEEDITPIRCGRGMHFCKKAADCFNYYNFNPENKVAEVIAYGDIAEEGDKCCTNKLEIVREIPWAELLEIVNVDGERILDCTKELVFVHFFGHQAHAINELVAKFTHVFSPPKGIFQTTQPLFTRSSACFRMAAPLQRP